MKQGRWLTGMGMAAWATALAGCTGLFGPEPNLVLVFTGPPANQEAAMLALRARIDRLDLTGDLITHPESIEVRVFSDDAEDIQALSAHTQVRFRAGSRTQQPGFVTTPVCDQCPPLWLGPTFIEGAHIQDARYATDEMGERVELTFDPVGAEALATYSTDHVGEILAIEVDGTVVSDPVIHEPIDLGRAWISLGHGPTRIQGPALAASLGAGALPMDWNLAETRVLDASE